MRFIFTILIFGILLFSCKKNQEEMEVGMENTPSTVEDIAEIPSLMEDRANICSSIGILPQMPILKRKNQLLRTERIQEIDEDKRLVYIDTFIYNANDELIAIKDRIINIKDEQIERATYEFEFQDNLLMKISIADYRKAISKDSLVYDEKGNLLRLFSFKAITDTYIPPIERTPYALFTIDSFFYDKKGYLNYRNCYWVSDKEYFSHSIYCWENGNVTNVKDYDGDGVIRSESITTYSEEKEFKVRQLDPRNWATPQIWSKNKALDSQFFDYVGNVDFVCNPCDTAYEYDDFGRLVKAANIHTTVHYTYRE